MNRQSEYMVTQNLDQLGQTASALNSRAQVHWRKQGVIETTSGAGRQDKNISRILIKRRLKICLCSFQVYDRFYIFW